MTPRIPEKVNFRFSTTPQTTFSRTIFFTRIAGAYFYIVTPNLSPTRRYLITICIIQKLETQTETGNGRLRTSRAIPLIFQRPEMILTPRLFRIPNSPVLLHHSTYIYNYRHPHLMRGQIWAQRLSGRRISREVHGWIT